MANLRRSAAGRSVVLHRRPRRGTVQADDRGRVLILQPRQPRAHAPRRISFDHQPHELVERA